MHQPIYIHERHHEARRATARVLVYSLHVLLQANRRRSNAVKCAQALPESGGAAAAIA